MELTQKELASIAKAILGIQQLEGEIEGVMFGPIPLVDPNGSSLGTITAEDVVFTWVSD